MEWGDTRQETKGAVGTAVWRRESGKEKDYLDFCHLGLFPQFNFWTKFLTAE